MLTFLVKRESKNRFFLYKILVYCLYTYVHVLGTYASADPEGGGGTGGLDPPWKITSYMGFYRE